MEQQQFFILVFVLTISITDTFFAYIDHYKIVKLYRIRAENIKIFEIENRARKWKNGSSGASNLCMEGG